MYKTDFSAEITGFIRAWNGIRSWKKIIITQDKYMYEGHASCLKEKKI